MHDILYTAFPGPHPADRILRVLKALEHPMDRAIESASRYPMDLIEQSDRYLVEIDAPGVTADQVRIEFHDNRVTIEIKRELPVHAGRVLQRERASDSAKRVLILSNLAEAGHEASITNGVLTVSLRKKGQEKPKESVIQVKVQENPAK